MVLLRRSQNRRLAGTVRWWAFEGSQYSPGAKGWARLGGRRGRFDANVPDAVHNGCPHRDLQRPDGGLAVESSDVDSPR
jgi:hypothetical protein